MGNPTRPLLELNPTWLDAGPENTLAKAAGYADGRRGIGLIFDCPCGCGTLETGQGLVIPFANPMDGGPTHEPAQASWERTGETFATLTLRPSILRSKARGGCGWHGYVTNGQVETLPS